MESTETEKLNKSLEVLPPGLRNQTTEFHIEWGVNFSTTSETFVNMTDNKTIRTNRRILYHIHSGLDCLCCGSSFKTPLPLYSFWYRRNWRFLLILQFFVLPSRTCWLSLPDTSCFSLFLWTLEQIPLTLCMVYLFSPIYRHIFTC